LAISIVGDYLNVFRIDLAYTLLFAILTALATNINAIKSWLGLEVEKTIEFECSRLMTEDNYIRMLKDAEIEHLTKEYDNLFVEFAKLGTIAKARAVKLLGKAGKIIAKEIEKMKKGVDDYE
jgi:p-aminobenzoyl-glutamate transporter AbgT